MKVEELLKQNDRFLRSINIERDFRDEKALDGYVLTRAAESYFGRILGGISQSSGQRAWRITGDYGTGKSNFALFVANAFSRPHSLPKHIKSRIDISSIRKPFLPILVVGQKSSISKTLISSLLATIEEKIKNHASLKSVKGMHSWLNNDIKNDAEAIELIGLFSKEIVSERKIFGGIVIIIDELGKFLEYSASHPEKQDVYFLQQLGELSSRSRNDTLFTIGILHQGFHAYADKLSSSSQQEWEKVAGRYEEILFNQPLEQICSIISSALGVKDSQFPKGSITGHAKRLMKASIDAGIYTTQASKSHLVELSPKLYPLNPIVIPAIIKFFSRYGQNERSLFSFLFSNEPYALSSFLNNEAGIFYSLHNFYDYINANFGQKLAISGYRNHWEHISSIIRSYETSGSEFNLSILKTIGVLNLLNSHEFLASESVVANSLNQPNDDDVKKEIARLKKSRVLYSKGSPSSYFLWAHSSVDLDSRYLDAKNAIAKNNIISKSIESKLDRRPLIARRHYIETGNMRAFSVKFCCLNELKSTIEDAQKNSDGAIVIALSNNSEEEREISKIIKSSENLDNLLIGVTKPLESLSDLVYNVDCWEWVSQNTPELKDDNFAAETVAKQVDEAKNILESRLESFIGIRNNFSDSSDLSIIWYDKGRESKSIKNTKDIILKLSEISDRRFPNTLRLHNELINRDKISTSVASARNKLVERLFKNSGEKYLGMDELKRPPEMAIYFSLLQDTDIHKNKGNTYYISIPKSEDKNNLFYIFNSILELIKSKDYQRVSVSKIYETLKSSPFGVKEGVIPVLLSILLIEYRYEIAIYEDGTFIPIVTENEIARLTKRPDTFELQYCEIKGVKKRVFVELSSLMNNDKLPDNSILAVVEPFCKFIAQLPEYTRNTEELSSKTRKVRECILGARDPLHLVFEELPKACELPPIDSWESSKVDLYSEKYRNAIKSCFDELNSALPSLINRTKANIMQEFSNTQNFESFLDFRDKMSERAIFSVEKIKEPEIKVMLMKFMDTALDENRWVEIFASYISQTPISRWKKETENKFNLTLSQLADKFKKSESLFAGLNKNKSSSGVKISLLDSDGEMKESILFIDNKDVDKLNNIKQQINDIIKESGNIGLAAIAKILMKKL